MDLICHQTLDLHDGLVREARFTDSKGVTVEMRLAHAALAEYELPLVGAHYKLVRVDDQPQM